MWILFEAPCGALVDTPPADQVLQLSLLERCYTCFDIQIEPPDKFLWGFTFMHEILLRRKDVSRPTPWQRRDNIEVYNLWSTINDCAAYLPSDESRSDIKYATSSQFIVFKMILLNF